MASIFFGHGSPMNAIEENEFTDTMKKAGRELPSPPAILCISAHWVTSGTYIQSSEHPKQIFDFSGFSKELHKIIYEPLGSPQYAKKINLINHQIIMSTDWGIDHGAWSILHHMYPSKNIPVMQLSIDKNLSPIQHYKLAQSLSEIYREGVLCLGSGNIVHNLREISWNASARPFDWALEFEHLTVETVTNSNLSNEEKVVKIFSLDLLKRAHPTIEHLVPLIYNLGVLDKMISMKVLSRGIQNASISMTSFTS